MKCLFVFQFGGKLITFGKERPPSAEQSPVHNVYVSQVITEPILVNKSIELEQALEYGNFTGKLVKIETQNYCLTVNYIVLQNIAKSRLIRYQMSTNVLSGIF